MSAHRNAVKPNFQTGDFPTQAQFYQWMDWLVFDDEYDSLWVSELQSEPMTGWVSGAGAITATDTVFQMLQKLDGNMSSNFLHKNQDDTFTGKLTVSGSIEGAASGPDYILNIGTDHTSIINVGKAGLSTINVFGNQINWNPIQSTVKDQLITLNKGGGAGTATGTGWEIEENAIITGYVKTVSTRDGYRFKAPSIASQAAFGLQNLTADRTYTLPDNSGEILVSTLVRPTKFQASPSVALNNALWTDDASNGMAIGYSNGVVFATATQYNIVNFSRNGTLFKTNDGTYAGQVQWTPGIHSFSGQDASGIFLFDIQNSGFEVYGSGAFPGVVYLSDFSSNYTSRSLIDKGYATATFAPITGGSYLPLAGGTLTGSVLYSPASNLTSSFWSNTQGFYSGYGDSSTIPASTIGSFTQYKKTGDAILAGKTSTGSTSLSVGLSGFQISSSVTGFAGAVYSADYSGAYTTRSLVDAGYVTTTLGSYLPLAGGTLTGNLILNSNATAALGAVTLQQLNAAVVGLYDLRGGYDASGNTFPTTGGSGTSGAINKADVWIITVTGTLGGTIVQINDQITALVDTPGQTAANWNIITHDFGFTPLSNAMTSTYMFVGNSSNIATPTNISGDWTMSNTGVATISSAAVTYAKFQNVAASSLVGNPTGSSAVSQGVTLGAGLGFTGTTLYVPAGAITNAMLGTAYIPYTGSTTNVDLNAKTIVNASTITIGATSQGVACALYVTDSTAIAASGSYLFSTSPTISTARSVNPSDGSNMHSIAVYDLHTKVGVNGTGQASFTDNAQCFGTANYLHHVGFQTQYQYHSSGTMDDYWGFVDVPVFHDGTTTNRKAFYAFDAQANSGTGTVTNNYGFYCDAMSFGTSKNYAFYSVSANSYFGGNTIFGSATDQQIVLNQLSSALGDLGKGVYMANNATGSLTFLPPSGGGTTGTCSGVYYNSAAYKYAWTFKNTASANTGLLQLMPGGDGVVTIGFGSTAGTGVLTLGANNSYDPINLVRGTNSTVLVSGVKTGFTDSTAIGAYNDSNGSLTYISSNYYLTDGGSNARFNTSHGSWAALMDNRSADRFYLYRLNSSGTAAIMMQVDNTGQLSLPTAGTGSVLINGAGTFTSAYSVVDSTKTFDFYAQRTSTSGVAGLLLQTGGTNNYFQIYSLGSAVAGNIASSSIPNAGLSQLISGNYDKNMSFHGSGIYFFTSLSASTYAVGITSGGTLFGKIANMGTVANYYIDVLSGDIGIGTAGKSLRIKTGTNSCKGTGTLVGGTVTISTTAVESIADIFLTDTGGGGNIGAIYVSACVPGTSFTVSSINILDTSTFNWVLIRGY